MSTLNTRKSCYRIISTYLRKFLESNDRPSHGGKKKKIGSPIRKKKKFSVEGNRAVSMGMENIKQECSI